jgi:hypothetical protein
MIFTAFIVIILLVLGGCVSNMPELPPTRDVRIWFGIGEGEFTLFELVGENVFDVTLLGDMSNSFFVSKRNRFDESRLDEFINSAPGLSGLRITSEGWFRRIISRGRLDFQQQSDVIWELIDNVVENGPNKEFERLSFSGDFNLFFAIIDGEMYWSLYDIKSNPIFPEYVNDELLLLAYELIDLSPIPVGGAANPLKTPKR